MMSPKKTRLPPSQTNSPWKLLLALAFLDSSRTTAGNNNNNTKWQEAGRMTGAILQECLRASVAGPQEQFLETLQHCLERGTLLLLDNSFQKDDIKIFDGVRLIRYRPDIDDTNDTRIYSRNLEAGNMSEDDWSGKESDWRSQVWRRVARVLHTHVLKIELNALEGAKLEARHRRRRHHMMGPLMMFGVVAVGLIMIPMGFQFLAVLGGKALLLAKMALLLTSIQGLKKIATSNLNYGLYAAPAHSQWQYDRQWPYGGADGPDTGNPYNHYDLPEQQTDLLHPLQPRVDKTGKYRKHFRT